MERVILPTRLEMTVGSAEYEEVIKCFETEKKVVFKRNFESSDSKEKFNGLRVEKLDSNSWKTSNDESESTASTCRQKGKANQSRPDHIIRSQGWVVKNGRRHRGRLYSSPNCLLSSFRDLSLEGNETSVESGISTEKVDIVNQSRKVRSNSTPNIPGGTLKDLTKGKTQLRRNSTSETFRSDRKPKRGSVIQGKAISSKSSAGFANRNRYGHLIHPSHEQEKIELEGENHILVLVRNQSTRKRRASLPSRVNTDRWSAISPKSLTEMHNTCFDPNAKIFFPRRSSGPDTYTSLKYSRKRRSSLPTSYSETSEKLPGIMPTVRNKQLRPEFPVDVGRGASLENVLRLWNVRLPKQLAKDLKKELEDK